jgi:hypothetical protein
MPGLRDGQSWKQATAQKDQKSRLIYGPKPKLLTNRLTQQIEYVAGCATRPSNDHNDNPYCEAVLHNPSLGANFQNGYDLTKKLKDLLTACEHRDSKNTVARKT